MSLTEYGFTWTLSRGPDKDEKHALFEQTQWPIERNAV